MPLGRITAYLRDCYHADTSRSALWNIYGGKVSHRVFARGAEAVLSAEPGYLPILPEEGGALEEASRVYRQERELIYGALFLVGRLHDAAGQPQTVCAPLVYQPGELRAEDNHLALRVDAGDRRINHRVIEALPGDDGHEQLAATLRDMLGSGPLPSFVIGAVAELFRESFPKLDVEAFETYPTLADEAALQAALARLERQPGYLALIPCAVAALIERSRETRGVLAELDAMRAATRWSAPLRILLGVEAAPAPALDTAPVVAPAVLSAAQRRIVQSARRAPLSVVVGPPGTGKSYTITCLALEHLARGETVLVASKMDHAVDVVAGKAAAILGNRHAAVRAGRKHYRDMLRTRLEHMLVGLEQGEPVARGELVRLRRRLAGVRREIARLERCLRRRGESEIRWGQALADGARGLWRRWIEFRVRRTPLLAATAAQLERGLERRMADAGELIRRTLEHRRQHLLNRRRKELQGLMEALRARTGTRQEELFANLDYDALLDALPLWLVNLADAHQALPFQPELFDLVIIDEASQCDMASSLPLLQRARRAVIVGDPKQLRHISFLSRAQQRELAARHGLDELAQQRYDYRERSLLDLVCGAIDRQADVHFLDEHFRSAPAIIGFSNQRFYADAIRLMTDTPRQLARESLKLVRVDGKRGRNGVNKVEAEAVIEAVRAVVESERGLAAGACHSIGVLSPFRAQVDYLAQALASALKAEGFERHQVLVATPYGFQGEERDLMFLSLGYDGGNAAALRYLERPDVFNVGITRAKVTQTVFTSLPPGWAAPGDSLLGDYLAYIDTLRNGPPADGPGHDYFMEEVAEAFTARGWTLWRDYPLHGLRVDLLAERGGRGVAVDLIGYPGYTQAAVPVERYRIFHRMGLPVLPLAYSEWRLRREECLAALERWADG